MSKQGGKRKQQPVKSRKSPERPPDGAQALLAEGQRLLEADASAQAVSILSRAVRQFPDDAHTLALLARAYRRDGNALAALKTFDRLIEIGAADETVWCETANTLTDVFEYAQAVGAYENSINSCHRNPEAHHNLARVLYRLGELDRALDHLKIAAAQCQDIDPWLSLATMIPGCPSADPEGILAVRREFARRLSNWCGASDSPPRPKSREAKQRLRLGYLSAFFHRENYMKPVWGLINHHDRSAFEIHLFSDSPAEKGLPGYVPYSADALHETGELTNEKLAELIRVLDIDILVDLNAYSTAERLPLFLQHPAPLTLAWFNMYATSGLPGFDYIVGDEEVVQQGEERFFCERVLRLPVSYLTFEVTHDIPPVSAPPCVKNGFLTFGSLVSQYKITPTVLDAWSDLLRAAPAARLYVSNPALKSVHNRAYLAEQFTRRGIDTERLMLEGPADHYAFIQKYDRIDIALDAFPYNGGTTTMEAICQGVPVVTFDGDRWASRTSQSLLRNSHLSDFVAESAAGYVELAAAFARDAATPTKLIQLRREMRDRLRAGSVCDTRTLAKAMERLYRAAWRER